MFVFIFIRLLISTSREVITLSGVHPTYSHNNTLIQTDSSKQPRNNNQSPFDKQYLTINTGNLFNIIPIFHPFCHIFDLKEGGYYKHILLPKQNHCQAEQMHRLYFCTLTYQIFYHIYVVLNNLVFL